MMTTNYPNIIDLIDHVDPIKYGKTRNYIDGAVTRLSPYISRGVISTKQVALSILSKGYKLKEIDQFLKELAWRDYFQQVWIAKKSNIDKDIKQPQSKVSNTLISTSIVNSCTGIQAIDTSIQELYATGYMHNHLRMYVASMCCNIAQSYWQLPAKWMYYYLLDADWASNTLSWQWVAGSFSSKKYFANQQNINQFCYTKQTNTFLDIPYEEIESREIPDELKELTGLVLKTNLPSNESFIINDSLPFCVYNFYNLDSNWLKNIEANRILILEPSFFRTYPVCDKTIDFILDLSKNIPNIQIFVGEFEDLFQTVASDRIHFKEHPTNMHYRGVTHTRDWMFEEVKGYYPSFFAYWKECEKHMKNIQVG